LEEPPDKDWVLTFRPYDEDLCGERRGNLSKAASLSDKYKHALKFRLEAKQLAPIGLRKTKLTSLRLALGIRS
jgi:hypothetical protein